MYLCTSSSRSMDQYTILFVFHTCINFLYLSVIGLTLRNQVFFEACDGIFTNYTWKREEPANSGMYVCMYVCIYIPTYVHQIHQSSSSPPIIVIIPGGRAGLSRRYDVYMGIDAFGRNTYGGGGYDVNVALEVIRNAGTSAALFAPGW